MTVLAGRAYDSPPFLDRRTARGWSFVVRLKLGSVVFRDHQGRVQPPRALVERQVQRPGQRGKGRGPLFKTAGWRRVRVVAYWQPGEDERMVVVTDGPPSRAALGEDGRRFWCEPAVRADKTAGWQWEQRQVRGVHDHAHLLLAMAWASLRARCLGVEAAHETLARLACRQRRPGTRFGRPRHARTSLFTLGLRRLRRWCSGTARGPLPGQRPHLDAPGWNREYHAAQSPQLIHETVRP